MHRDNVQCTIKAHSPCHCEGLFRSNLPAFIKENWLRLCCARLSFIILFSLCLCVITSLICNSPNAYHKGSALQILLKTFKYFWLLKYKIYQIFYDMSVTYVTNLKKILSSNIKTKIEFIKMGLQIFLAYAVEGSGEML